MTIYANVEKKEIINNTSGKGISDALVALYLGSAVFMVLGICGLYGAIQARKKVKSSGNCLLGLYFIGLMLFLLIFLAGAIFFFVGPEAIFGTDCQHGSKTELVAELYKLNVEADSTFCSADCECYLDPKNVDSYLGTWLTDNGYVFNTVQERNKNYQSCMTEERANSPNVLLMAALEERGLGLQPRHERAPQL